MKKIISSTVFALFLFCLLIRTGYAFNYSAAKCTLIPLPHSVKLKMSADVYSFFNKYLSLNKRLSVNYGMVNYGINYTVVVKTAQFSSNPNVEKYYLNYNVNVFLFKNGDLIGTYQSVFTPVGGSGLSQNASFDPNYNLCGIALIGTGYGWEYFPIFPSIVDTIVDSNGRTIKQWFVYNHIVSGAEISRIYRAVKAYGK